MKCVTNRDRPKWCTTLQSTAILDCVLVQVQARNWAVNIISSIEEKLLRKCFVNLRFGKSRFKCIYATLLNIHVSIYTYSSRCDKLTVCTPHCSYMIHLITRTDCISLLTIILSEPHSILIYENIALCCDYNKPPLSWNTYKNEIKAKIKPRRSAQ